MSRVNIKDLNTPRFWDEKFRETKKMGGMERERLNIIADRVKNTNGASVLNVGFGLANLERILDQAGGLKLHGIDISRVAVQKVNALNIGTFKIGNILKITYPSNKFDVVIASEILEHISSSKTHIALRELGRVLKKNGELIVSVPTNEGLSEMLARGENPNGHMREYTFQILKGELKSAGFEIESVQYLYAFANLYKLKKFLQKYILKSKWLPNNIIVVARKP